MSDPHLATLQATFLRDLLDAKLLVATGVPGLYGKSGVFEVVIEGIDRVVREAAAGDGAEVLRFPPLVPRANFEKIGYMKSFPQLAGSVHAFMGADKDHKELLKRLEAGEDWSRDLQPAAVVLQPAACYPVYPTASGTLPEGGRLFDVASYCFRHEPSEDPARMQIFRMHELVRVGSIEHVQAFRDTWFERADQVLTRLALPHGTDVANDPFFGRGGKVLASGQREQALKFELLVPIYGEEHPTAVASLNYHQDHFASVFDIRTASGATAHTACIGFGLERIALAMLRLHGLDPKTWPEAVRGIALP